MTTLPVPSTSPAVKGLLTLEREEFHRSMIGQLLVLCSAKVKGRDYPSASNADGSQAASRAVAVEIANRLGAAQGTALDGQTSGNLFERCTERFLTRTFLSLSALRPGKWSIKVITSRQQKEMALAAYEQYRHLSEIAQALEEHPQLKTVIGNDYMIAPDIVIGRDLEDDGTINAITPIVDNETAKHASIRKSNGGAPLLHANVSCKWTIRSDRSQNSRSEALNLIRARKGRVPHIAIVTAEPLPSRIASIALGTGDIDCVYHFALPELQSAVATLGQSEATELLQIMIEGRRLRDISDLPLDLAT